VAVASAGPYASLHLAPDRQPRQHSTTQFFTGRMTFLQPNRQRQSTEGKSIEGKFGTENLVKFVYVVFETYEWAKKTNMLITILWTPARGEVIQ